MCHQMDFAVAVDKSFNLINKYLDPGTVLKKLWNMKVMVMLIKVGVLEKRLEELETKEKLETI